MQRHLRSLKTLVKPYFRQIVLASVFLRCALPAKFSRTRTGGICPDSDSPPWNWHFFNWHPVLATIAISPLIPMVLLTTNFGKRVGRLLLAVDNTLGELSSILQENVVGVQVMRAFAQEKHETERYD